MHVFITGVGGYIGGSIAAKLTAAGHHVSGLVRSPDKAARLRERGIEPVPGALVDTTILAGAARRADAVIDTADSDSLYVADALLAGLEGSGKCLLHTSGSSVVADRAAGEPGGRVFNEDTPSDPLPERMLRVAVDRLVLASTHRGVRSVVLRPGLIYGRGRGLNPHSLQVPKLIELSRKSGAGLHVGRGLNVWSNVHIDDVVDAYVLALAVAPAGSLFYVENGEASMKAVAQAISRMLGFDGATRDWPIEEALRELGGGAYTSYGSNSRVRSAKARAMLGWSPKRDALLEEIERGCYREDVRGD